MSFIPRRRAARPLAAMALAVALLASVAVPGAAFASSSTITQQDCNQGTIKDQSGNAISKARCEKLIGKSVQLASTGLDLWPILLVGVACVGGAAVLLRSRRPARQLI